MTVNFVNLCPHALRLRTNVANKVAEADPTDIVVEPRRNADGKPDSARVSTTPGGKQADVGGVAAYGPTTYGEVEGLPAPEQDTVYLVSALVAGRPAVVGRTDVFVPGTGPNDGAVRYADGPQKGQVYAVTRLVQA